MGNTRSSRLVSRDFREKLGDKLRSERLKLNYTQKDLAIMTTLTTTTIHFIENGNITNIDYYVEYAKAVGYDFGKFKEFGIELVPKVPLPEEHSKRINLTSKIKSFIIQGQFLGPGKTVSEIKKQLVNLKQINASEVSSADIAGVMRNLLKDNIVQIQEKTGHKNIYINGSE